VLSVVFRTQFRKILKNTYDLLRSAYTVDEKAVFKIVATTTVFETFTYQVSETSSNQIKYS